MGAVLLAGSLFAAGGQAIVRHVPELLALLMVLGMTVGLGMLTFDAELFWGEIKNIFRRTGSEDRNYRKWMRAQLALYALVSGLVSAIVQVLMRMGADSQAATAGQGLVSRQIPFLTLLYGVLTAVGLWVLAGLDKPTEEARQRNLSGQDRNQVIVAFAVLLLTVGVLSVLVMSVNIASSRSKTDQMGMAREVVQHMHQGPDLVWRPLKSGVTNEPTESTLLPRPKPAPVEDQRGPEDSVMASSADVGGLSMPPLLRWEVEIEGEATESVVRQAN